MKTKGRRESTNVEVKAPYSEAEKRLTALISVLDRYSHNPTIIDKTPISQRKSDPLEDTVDDHGGTDLNVDRVLNSKSVRTLREQTKSVFEKSPKPTK